MLQLFNEKKDPPEVGKVFPYRENAYVKAAGYIRSESQLQNTFSSLEDAATGEPYCFKVPDHWRRVLFLKESGIGTTTTIPNFPVYVLVGVNREEKKFVTRTTVVIKDHLPIQGNEVTGLIFVDGKFFVTSGVFHDEKNDDKFFVLLARQETAFDNDPYMKEGLQKMFNLRE
ncbi:MAG TPA: hypothetical protein VLH19_05160 [Patescibacteria group bacterium]|nr:hypothetical protein [Patescibacteria group bacterium]